MTSHPKCARCPLPILPGEPAAHRDGHPFVHLACLGKVELDRREQQEDQRLVRGLQRKGDGFVPVPGSACRRVPPAKGAP